MKGDAFDHIGIERALRQKFRRAAAVLGDLLRLLVEGLDEEPADDFALFFRLGDAFERREKDLARLHMMQRNIVMAAKERDDLFRLALPQHAVIDEDADELIADRLMDQHGGHGGIDAARKTAEHPALADLGADRGDRPRRERRPWSNRV